MIQHILHSQPFPPILLFPPPLHTHPSYSVGVLHPYPTPSTHPLPGSYTSILIPSTQPLRPPHPIPSPCPFLNISLQLFQLSTTLITSNFTARHSLPPYIQFHTSLRLLVLSIYPLLYSLHLSLPILPLLPLSSHPSTFSILPYFPPAFNLHLRSSLQLLIRL